ncbi:MAG: hypothetical protein GX070_07895, partial [Alcaligenaceae bacterium]|nr:hypothetical protein [Alcaligenaceae bacterium]
MKWLKRATVVACAGALYGCVGNSSDSAWRLMEDQQQEQAMMQRQEMDDARKKVPEQQQLLVLTIKEAQDQGRYFASLAFIDEYDAKYGKSPDVEILRAEALRRTDQQAQSEEIYRKLTKTRQRAQAYHGLGIMAGQRGDFSQAAQDLAAASEAAPADAVILSDLAYARMRIGDIEGARIPIGKAAELLPQNAKVLSNMSLYLLVRGATTAAEQVMRSANLNERARQEIYAIAEQIRHLPPAPVQASRSSSRQNNSTVQGVSNVSSGQTYAEAAKKKEPVNVAPASSEPPQPEADFELMVPANAPALASNIQPRPQNRPGVQVQPAAAPELVPQGQQAQARAEVQPEPAPAEPEAP